MSEVQRRAGRPTTPVLTQEKVLKAAFDLAGECSPSQFTMTALATSLGVRPSALYHHFSGRNAVIRSMRAHIGSLIDIEPFRFEPLDDALLAWGRSYRAAMLTAPGAITLLAVLPIDADELSLAQYEAIAERLTADGWPLWTVVDAIVAIESFVIGSALDAMAPADNMSPGKHATHFPRFAEAEHARRTTWERPADHTFDVGLRALIAGLRSWAARKPPASA